MKTLVRLGCAIGIVLSTSLATLPSALSATPAAAVPAKVAEPSHCFRNVGLKTTYSIHYMQAGEKVNGAFLIESPDGEPQKYPFTGDLHARRLTVTFTEEKVPEILTHERPLWWRLVPVKGGDNLQVRIYGQNYQTKKFSNYNITFEPCGPKNGG